MKWPVNSLIRRIARWCSLDIDRKPKSLIDAKGKELQVDVSLLASRLKEIKGQGETFFIVVGANDGVRDEIFMPVALGNRWSGVLLEPHPVYFQELAQRFTGNPNIQCLNAAIDERPGERMLYSVETKPGMPKWVGGLASFDRGHLLRHEPLIPGVRKCIREDKVRCESFASLLSLLQRDQFDVLQIDTEGYDAEILRMADIPRRLPMIINFEHKHLSMVDWDKSVRMLLDCGYRVAKVGQDTLAFRPPI